MQQTSLFAGAKNAGGRTAIIDAHGSHSYRQLWESSAKLSRALLGPRADLEEARICYLVAPGFDYVCTQWGIWRAGGVAVPLGMTHPTPELAYVIDDVGPSAIVVSPEFRERLQPIIQSRKLRVISTAEILDTGNHGETGALPTLACSRRAMILYTSGSTGKPKGVVSTHGNIAAQVDALVEAWEWTANDHILHVLPLHHVHGIINVLACALRVGATCEFHAFEPQSVWNRFARSDLTLFMAVPTIYAKLIAAFERASTSQQSTWTHGASRMRLMVSGSAALPIPTLENWQKITGQRLLERYGMTEIGMALSNPLHGERRSGHVGRPLPNVEARRTNDAGEIPADDIPGEIEIRGPSVFLEYWNKPEATAAAFRDGWFRTGDVAIVSNGDYRILGRQSVDIIKTGGYKVSALEIEDVLRTHGAILDCAVVGIADDEWGERVAACVVCRDNAAIELIELRAWAKDLLASYKVPTLLHVADELPRNAMGKVQKPLVRDVFGP
jgi:malonyl-CoA/methylmalonyl-CoA synthetase